MSVGKLNPFSSCFDLLKKSKRQKKNMFQQVCTKASVWLCLPLYYSPTFPDFRTHQADTLSPSLPPHHFNVLWTMVHFDEAGQFIAHKEGWAAPFQTCLWTTHWIFAHSSISSGFLHFTWFIFSLATGFFIQQHSCGRLQVWKRTYFIAVSLFFLKSHSRKNVVAFSYK